LTPIHAVQPPYNLFERDAERAILPYAERNGIAVLAYGALCRGLLTGKISTATRFADDDLRNTDPKFREPRLSQYLSAVVSFDRLAQRRYRKDVLALALRWIIDRRNTIALWGARHAWQLDGVAGVMGWSIGDDVREQIEGILARTIKDPVGPEFMAPLARRDVREVA
jgi:aryl-alcohol dehydrogenase-like predicted oxidoreductase